MLDSIWIWINKTYTVIVFFIVNELRLSANSPQIGFLTFRLFRIS